MEHLPHRAFREPLGDTVEGDGHRDDPLGRVLPAQGPLLVFEALKFTERARPNRPGNLSRSGVVDRNEGRGPGERTDGQKRVGGVSPTSDQDGAECERRGREERTTEPQCGKSRNLSWDSPRGSEKGLKDGESDLEDPTRTRHLRVPSLTEEGRRKRVGCWDLRTLRTCARVCVCARVAVYVSHVRLCLECAHIRCAYTFVHM